MVCGAVHLPPSHVPIPGIVDSKRITSEDERERLFELIVASPGVRAAAAVVDAETIDRVNILQGTMLGMRMSANAVIKGVMGEGNKETPNIDRRGCYVWYKGPTEGGGLGESYALVDGNRFPNTRENDKDEVKGGPDILCPGEAVVKGDGKEYCIAAASVVAKVTRDRLMHEYDERFPGYGLGQHKGYPTKGHCEAIYQKGVLEIHRRTFAPIKNMEGVK